MDVRVVTATNRPLEEMVAGKGFREDLFFRLNVVNVKIPPLRERREEIPRLVEHFLRRFNAKYGKYRDVAGQQPADVQGSSIAIPSPATSASSRT